MRLLGQHTRVHGQRGPVADVAIRVRITRGETQRVLRGPAAEGGVEVVGTVAQEKEVLELPILAAAALARRPAAAVHPVLDETAVWSLQTGVKTEASSFWLRSTDYSLQTHEGSVEFEMVSRLGTRRLRRQPRYVPQPLWRGVRRGGRKRSNHHPNQRTPNRGHDHPN